MGAPGICLCSSGIQQLSARHHIRGARPLLKSLASGATLSSSSSSSVVNESVIEFLKTVPPFQFLPAGELNRLVPKMTLEYFPKDTTIIKAGHRASDALYIVQKGAVELALRTQVGKQLVFDVRSEGELFGLLSLMGRDIARLDVVAVEDALCYSIPGAVVQEIGSRHPEFSEYLVRASITRYLDRSLKELKDQTNLMGNAERLLYSLAVKDVVSAPVVVCSAETSIGDAARLVAKSRATCLAVVGPDGRALGIVTDRDFTYRVLAKGVSLELPVETIMTSPVISVESSARLFQALLAMISKDIHHVLVIEEGLPKAVLSSHDLILLQGKSPLTVTRHLEQQKSVEGLASAQKKIMELIPLLLREGARVSHITRVVSEINDRLMARKLCLRPHSMAAIGSADARAAKVGLRPAAEVADRTRVQCCAWYREDSDAATADRCRTRSAAANQSTRSAWYPDLSLRPLRGSQFRARTPHHSGCPSPIANNRKNPHAPAATHQARQCR